MSTPSQVYFSHINMRQRWICLIFLNGTNEKLRAAFKHYNIAILLFNLRSNWKELIDLLSMDWINVENEVEFVFKWLFLAEALNSLITHFELAIIIFDILSNTCTYDVLSSKNFTRLIISLFFIIIDLKSSRAFSLVSFDQL